MILLVVLALAVIAPVAAIWALNTLFGLGIPYSIQAWLAVLVLVGVFGRKS